MNKLGRTGLFCRINRDRRKYLEKKELNFCLSCPIKAEPGKRHCAEHIKKKLESQQRRRKILKELKNEIVS